MTPFDKLIFVFGSSFGGLGAIITGLGVAGAVGHSLALQIVGATLSAFSVPMLIVAPSARAAKRADPTDS